MDYNVNKKVTDFLLSPEYIKEFTTRNFRNCKKIKCRVMWETFKEETKSNKIIQGKTALYYALTRDGWTIKRYSDTTYFLPPGTKPKRGRPAESETIKQLKKQIKDLQTENKKLKQIINKPGRSDI